MKQPSTYYHVKNSDAKIQVHQGGTRSGKTYSILQCVVELCHYNTGLVVSIVRKTLPSLKGTAMRDFFEILEKEGVYDVDLHNKSENTYKLWNNVVEFMSIDQPQKVRGRKRDVLFVNEANELALEDWRQLLLRTTGRIIIDYNPSDEYHWIYEQVLTRDDVDFFQTTYKDNPFLSADTVAEIERLKAVDENYWRVYGLGERGLPRASILTHWKECPMPDGYRFMGYGLDFGYTNDPTAVVAVFTDGWGLWVSEVVYGTGMTNDDIANELREWGVTPHDLLVADSAEPKSIDQIHSRRFNIHPCEKGADSVRAGIDYLRARPLGVSPEAHNLIKELRNYRWVEDKNGHLLNKPQGQDHAIDALRYIAMWKAKRPNYGTYTFG
jgi:phage terminase large subunit